MAWLGEAGWVRQGMARSGWAWRGRVWRGKAGSARRGQAGQGRVRQGGRGRAGRGRAWTGDAWRGTAGRGKAGRETVSAQCSPNAAEAQTRNETHTRTDDMNITVNFIGTSPLLMHNPRMVDPEFPINKQIKELTSKRKKTADDLKAIERLEWYGGLYTSSDGDDAIVTQPSSKMRKCVVETGRIHKLGKQVERALNFEALHVPLDYEGGTDVDALFKSGRYTSRLSVGIGQKRVMRVRPSFFPWSLSADAFFLEDVMNIEELTHIVSLAGRAVGVGDNRVNGYGRFVGTVTVND
jgi:hypothetical protein